MVMPALSIVMPVRDAAGTLDECLASIARQSFADYELLIVDDGSTDDSVDCVQRWAEKDARIRLIRRTAQGIVSALNAGLSAARAPLVARMDADDRMHTERLRLQVGYLQQHPKKMCRLEIVNTSVGRMPVFPRRILPRVFMSSRRLPIPA
jgi:glycosyltransferase involved in cell wall biosynthesis